MMAAQRRNLSIKGKKLDQMGKVLFDDGIVKNLMATLFYHISAYHY
jgi:hypothetical protein